MEIDRTVTITISGQPGVGKTTIAAHLAKALKDVGISVELTDDTTEYLLRSYLINYFEQAPKFRSLIRAGTVVKISTTGPRTLPSYTTIKL